MGIMVEKVGVWGAARVCVCVCVCICYDFLPLYSAVASSSDSLPLPWIDAEGTQVSAEDAWNGTRRLVPKN